jgi:hypothetical protein
VDIKDFIGAIEPMQATTADADPAQDLVLLSLTSLAVSARRIADALVLSNAAHLAGVQMDPASPGAMAITQEITKGIVEALREQVRPKG